jgi:hypothetical protein
MEHFENLIHRYIKDGTDFKTMDDYETNLSFYQMAMEHNITLIFKLGIEHMRKFIQTEQYELADEVYNLMKMGFDVYWDIMQPDDNDQLKKDMGYYVLIDKLMEEHNEH